MLSFCGVNSGNKECDEDHIGYFDKRVKACVSIFLFQSKGLGKYIKPTKNGCSQWLIQFLMFWKLSATSLLPWDPSLVDSSATSHWVPLSNPTDVN